MKAVPSGVVVLAMPGPARTETSSPAQRFSSKALAAFALALALGMLGCRDARGRAEKALDTADVRALRHDAAVLYKDLFGASAKAPFVPVPPEMLPKSMTRFAPRRAVAYPDGIALVLQPTADRESGLYVVPEGMEHNPAEGPRATFYPLREGIYWYEFGGGKK
jgi:hypothetical protein